MTEEIRTARLLLRRAASRDLKAFHGILSDPEATRFWSTPPHVDREQTSRWLQAMMRDAPDLSDDYVIERDGRVIGKAGCWRLPEIGFILHPSHWGRGLAREALLAVTTAILGRHPIPEITADVDPRNEASLRVLASIGFVATGRAERTWQVGGVWCDSVYLALSRPPSGQ